MEVPYSSENISICPWTHPVSQLRSLKSKEKNCGLRPQANYTDWATAACRRS
jgi:hypothetical protein